MQFAIVGEEFQLAIPLPNAEAWFQTTVLLRRVGEGLSAHKMPAPVEAEFPTTTLFLTRQGEAWQ